MTIATGLSTCGKEQKDQNNLAKTEMLPDNYGAKVTIKTRFFLVRRYYLAHLICCNATFGTDTMLISGTFITVGQYANLFNTMSL